MSLEPVGIFTLIVGFACMMAGYRATFIAFSMMTVFGGAAAFLIGSAGIQPGHLFVAFLVLTTVSYREKLAAVFDAMAFPKAAFWLACLIVYGILAGYFAPRLLARTMDIIPLGSTEYPETLGAVPLGPVSSNFTQAVYLIADLVTFVMVVALGSTAAGFRAVCAGVMCFVAANISFGIIDLVSYGTPVQELLVYIRNAPYAFHDEDIVAGVKRVVGSWPEASTFAGVSLGAIGFTGTMWICERHSRINFILFLMSSILVVRSTSSTGLFGLPVCLVLLYLACLLRCGGPSGTKTSAGIVIFAPLAIIITGMAIVMNDTLFRQIYDYFDLLVFSKGTTSSGIERGMWNRYGIANFIDSFGLGVGLGTSRTSSFVVALLSNVGIPGTLFFLLFFFSAIIMPRGQQRNFEADTRLAARVGCVCLLVGAAVSASTVDLGLLFFIMAGLASSVPVDSRRALPVRPLYA
ncbi:hypothetical protein [Neorhizobium sp. JUb45]|uniref:hypothetical protein n=1 Tax=unclassified Neorhizobium TaxID=2629175 RepID=UPI00104CEA67|nr:hypothetical protein [Neorhizobium sp. JUb45]TCQ99965.1 hypothetical protein EDF70_10743 [Neorhizobium sp. JUb45]